MRQDIPSPRTVFFSGAGRVLVPALPSFGPSVGQTARADYLFYFSIFLLYLGSKTKKKQKTIHPNDLLYILSERGKHHAIARKSLYLVQRANSSIKPIRETLLPKGRSQV